MERARKERTTEVEALLNTDKSLRLVGLSKIQDILKKPDDREGSMKRKDKSPTQPTRQSKRGRTATKIDEESKEPLVSVTSTPKPKLVQTGPKPPTPIPEPSPPSPKSTEEQSKEPEPKKEASIQEEGSTEVPTPAEIPTATNPLVESKQEDEHLTTREGEVTRDTQPTNDPSRTPPPLYNLPPITNEPLEDSEPNEITNEHPKDDFFNYNSFMTDAFMRRLSDQKITAEVEPKKDEATKSPQ